MDARGAVVPCNDLRVWLTGLPGSKNDVSSNVCVFVPGWLPVEMLDSSAYSFGAN